MNKKIVVPAIIMLIIFSASLSGQQLPDQNDRSFLDPPKIIKNPSTSENYLVENRKFTGIPSMAISNNGRLWATWYTGISAGEDQNNYVVIATSGDQGSTWKEVLVIDPDGTGPVRAFDPEAWIDPDGKLWFFWAQSIDGDESKHNNGINTGVWAITIRNADTESPKWSKPRRLTDGIMMCKPTVLSTGEWILPASTWKIKDGARVVVSTDKGKRWTVRGAVNVPETIWNCDEHMIVERLDGSLWMLVRTTYGIGESTSDDGGKTWNPLVPSQIQHPTARFYIRRLDSGNLLLVKHGPVSFRTGRSHLTAYVSDDDGHSWSKGLLLDERTGVSYPDGQQDKDGRIHIIYDYNRTRDQMILLTSFNEDDITGSGSNDINRQYKVVSKGGKD